MAFKLGAKSHRSSLKLPFVKVNYYPYAILVLMMKSMEIILRIVLLVTNSVLVSGNIHIHFTKGSKIVADEKVLQALGFHRNDYSVPVKIAPHQHFLHIPKDIFLRIIDSANIAYKKNPANILRNGLLPCYVEENIPIQSNEKEDHELFLQASSNLFFLIYEELLANNNITVTPFLEQIFEQDPLDFISLFDDHILERGIRIYPKEFILFDKSQPIGQGSYSNVFSCVIESVKETQEWFSSTESGETLECVYKQFKLDILNEDDVYLGKNAKITIPNVEELHIHSFIGHHDYIVGIIAGVIEHAIGENKVIGILLEKCEYGSLSYFMDNLPSDFKYEVYFFKELHGLVGALNHIHSQKILHRDIKILNIMVSQVKNYDQMCCYKLKLGDFSISCKMGKCEMIQDNFNLELLQYYPPEFFDLIIDQSRDFCQFVSFDWYQFGCLLRDIASKIFDRTRNISIMNILIPLAQTMYLVYNPLIRLSFLGVDQYFQAILSDLVGDFGSLVVCTVIFLNYDEFKDTPCPICRCKYGDKEDETFDRSLFDYSLAPNIFMSFMCVPVGSELRIFFEENVEYLPVKFVVRPILFRFSCDFPTHITSSFTSYQPKKFFKGEIASIDTNFSSSICFCDDPCVSQEVPATNHCLQSVNAEKIIEMILEVGNRGISTYKCIIIIN